MLWRDNERLSVINHKFKVKCEKQKPPWQDIKRLSSPAARGRKAEGQAQGLITRVTDLDGVTVSISEVGYTKARILTG
jgi:hypothetical protein